MLVRPWLFTLLVSAGFSCGGTPPTKPPPAASPTKSAKPTLHVVAAVTFADFGFRSHQYFQIASSEPKHLTLAGSRVRMTATHSAVELPPRFQPAPSQAIRVLRSDAAEWRTAVDKLSSSSDLNQWAALLPATGLVLSQAALQGDWGKLTAQLQLVPGSAEAISSNRTETGSQVSGRVAFRLRPAAGKPAGPAVGTAAFSVELNRSSPLASRAWLRVDVQKLKRSPWPNFETPFTVVVAWCLDESNGATYNAGCLPKQTARRTRQQAARSYVGTNCEPRIAALATTMKDFPHEGWVNTFQFALARSTAGDPLRKSGVQVDLRGTGLSSSYRYGGASGEIQRARSNKKRGYSKGPIRIQLRAASSEPISKALRTLLGLLKPDDKLSIIAETTRPAGETFVPTAATAWVKRQVTMALAATRDDRASIMAPLAMSSYGVCTPLITLSGKLANTRANSRGTVLDAGLVKALRTCKCEGVDMDGIDAFRRLLATNDTTRRFREIAIPLSANVAAKPIVVTSKTTGQQLVDRLARLTPSERAGVRFVFK